MLSASLKLSFPCIQIEWVTFLNFLDGIQLKVQKRENTFDVKETGVGDNAIPQSFPSDTKHNDNLDPGTIIIPN